MGARSTIWHPTLLATAGLVGVLLVACGGNGYGGRYGAANTPVAASPAAAASSSVAPVIGVADLAAIGKALTDGAGRTLYTFSADRAGSGQSSCSGVCASAWPPLTASATPAPPGGTTLALGLIQRDDGSQQVTVGGRPLYRFVGDQKPGDATGNGLNAQGGTWSVAALQASASVPPTPAPNTTTSAPPPAPTAPATTSLGATPAPPAATAAPSASPTPTATAGTSILGY